MAHTTAAHHSLSTPTRLATAQEIASLHRVEETNQLTFDALSAVRRRHRNEQIQLAVYTAIFFLSSFVLALVLGGAL